MTTDKPKVIPLEISLHPGEVYRKLGCLAGRIGREEQHALIERLLVQALPLVQGAAAYDIYSVERIAADHLKLAGCPAISGPVNNHLMPAHRVAIFATTLGPELEDLIRLQTAYDAQIESLVLKAIGEAAVNAAVDAVADHLHWNEMIPEECLTPPLVPGCCGFELTHLSTLLGILDSRPIKLELLTGPVLKPVLSAVGLFGIAPHDRMEALGIPCTNCRLSTCRLNTRG